MIISSGKNTYEDFVVLYRTNAQSRVIEENFLRSGLPYILVGGVRFYERKEIKDILCYLRLLINPDESISKKRALKIGKRRYKKFQTLQNEVISKKKLDDYTTAELMNKTLKTTKYLDKYNQDTEEGLSRLENIKELDIKELFVKDVE